MALAANDLVPGSRPNRLIHSLPHRRQGIVLGLVNVRGELLICVSLARLLGIVPDPHPPSRGRVGGAGPADSLAPVATARHRGESDARGRRDGHDRLRPLKISWEIL